MIIMHHNNDGDGYQHMPVFLSTDQCERVSAYCGYILHRSDTCTVLSLDDASGDGVLHIYPYDPLSA